MQSSAGDQGPGEVLAVDIGGTKMAAAVVDRGGEILWSARVPTPQDATAGRLWSTLSGLLAEMPRDHLLAVCGVGCGGPMGRGGEWVSPLNIPGWRRFPLRQRVAALTGLPVFVDNDAKALALGEGWIGAAAGQRDYMSMVVSTGVGGGIVLDGRLLEGGTGNAGHVGHLIVEPDGRRCGCGARGCLEAEASGTAIYAITGRPPADAPAELVVRTGRLVGRAVADVSNLLDLSLTTVSGSVALGYGRPFLEAAQREIEERSKLSYSAGCRIVASELGDSGPLIGAAAVGLRGLGALPVRSLQVGGRSGGSK
jgi:glucokinase